MDNFIKKIFDKQESDELVHSQFIKFSRGLFEERAMIRAKISSGNYTVETTSEYAKDLIMYLAEKIKGERVRVTGALITTFNLDGQLDYTERKMAMGVKKYMMDKEMSGDEILALCKKIEKAFFALSFSTKDTDLKVSVKSPKSAKGAGSSKNPDKKSKIDFIKIKTTDSGLVKNLIFDDEVKDFKKIEITHKILVEDIVMPKTDEKDFAKIREMAKRKGKIIRTINLDGNEIVKESGFEA